MQGGSSGPARRRALLDHFKTMKALRAATEEELAAVVPAGVARDVWRHLHPTQQQKEETPCE